MKLKGSVTLEAAVLIPLFTLIFVQLVFLALNCHDRAVANCTEDKVCMKAEFERPLGGEEDTGRTDECSRISRNNPVHFAWEADALEKLVQRRGDR